MLWQYVLPWYNCCGWPGIKNRYPGIYLVFVSSRMLQWQLTRLLSWMSSGRPKRSRSTLTSHRSMLASSPLRSGALAGVLVHRSVSMVYCQWHKITWKKAFDLLFRMYQKNVRSLDNVDWYSVYQWTASYLAVNHQCSLSQSECYK